MDSSDKIISQKNELNRSISENKKTISNQEIDFQDLRFSFQNIKRLKNGIGQSFHTGYPIIQGAFILNQEEMPPNPALIFKMMMEIINDCKSLYYNYRYTKGAEVMIKELLNSPDPYSFDSPKEIADLLVKKNILTIQKPQHWAKQNPNVSNPYSQYNVFSKEILQVMKTPVHTHRRHVIGRHVLGRAVYRASLRGDIESVNQFLIRFGENPQGNAYITAYKLLQNHAGNLWIGNDEENVVLGFFTGFAYNYVNTVLEAELQMCELGNESYFLLEDVLSILNETEPICSFGYAISFSESTKALLAEELTGASVLIDDEIPAIQVTTFVNIVNDCAENTEFDAPPEIAPAIEEAFYTQFIQISHSLDIFKDGLADAFMNSNINQSIEQELIPEEAEEPTIIETQENMYGLRNIDGRIYDPSMNTDSRGACLWIALMQLGIPRLLLELAASNAQLTFEAAVDTTQLSILIREINLLAFSLSENEELVNFYIELDQAHYDSPVAIRSIIGNLHGTPNDRPLHLAVFSFLNSRGEDNENEETNAHYVPRIG